LVQHTLLGAGLALIVAIVAALAAPLFVDWNAWRPVFEQRASMLVGAPVSIKGPIEASILPTPAFVMRDVTIGDSEHGTGLKSGQIRGVLSLGALFRGAFEAEEIILAKPFMRVALGRDGRILLGRGMPAETDAFSISRFTVEGGTLVVDGGTGGEVYRFDKVSATGELQSRSGPLKLDALLVRDGLPWKLRAAAGQFGNNGSGKLRFTLSRAKDNIQLEADGMLALQKAIPRFEGKISLTQQRKGALPWKLLANAKVSRHALVLDDLGISLGSEFPVELSGEARVRPRAHGGIEAALSAKHVDLDHIGDAPPGRDLVTAFAPLRNALAPFAGLPLSGTVDISADQLIAAGGTVRDLRARLSLHDGVFGPDRLTARLPGHGSVHLAGNVSKDGHFSGHLKLAAGEPSALANWIGLDTAGISVDDSGPFRLEGRLLASAKKFAIDQLALELADTTLGGNLAYAGKTAERPARIVANLNGDGVDLSLLTPVIEKALARTNAFDLDLSLAVREPRIFGQAARRFDAVISRDGGGLSIGRLAVEDLGGLNASAHGRIASYPERPDGRIEFTAEATRNDGLNALLETYGGGGEIAAYLHRVVAAGVPLHLAGTLNGDGSGTSVAIAADGSLNGTKMTFAARAEPKTMSLDGMHLALAARDASNLVALLGFPAPEPQAGQGRFEATIGQARKNAMPLKAHLVFPGIDFKGEGNLRFGDKGIEPLINLQLDATDLRALSSAAARSSGAVVPATGTARLIRSGGGVAFEDLALNFGDIRVRGRVSVKGIERPVLAGEFAVNRTRLSTLLTLALGRAGEGTPWSDQALGPPPFEGASGSFDIDSAALGLTGTLVATGTRLRLEFDDHQAAIRDLSGDFAGGKLTGHARVLRDGMLSFESRVFLKGADLARILAPGTWRSKAHGKGTFAIELSGQGASPAQLATNVAGRGSFSIESFSVDKLAPGAISKLFASTTKRTPPAADRITAEFVKAMEAAPLKIAKVAGPIVIAGGVARTGKVTAKSNAVDIVSHASLDLAKLNFDATVSFEEAAAAGLSVRPSAVIRWRGPIAHVERSVELTPLVTALSLRAMNNEIRELDARRNPPATSAIVAPGATESSFTPPQPPSAPVPHRRPRVQVPARAAPPPLPPPLEIGPAPGDRRPLRIN
jgi:hypothetical protein